MKTRVLGVRGVALVAAGWLCVGRVAAAQPPGHPATIQPTPAEVVMVDAVVVDRDGRPVTDLGEDEFVLRADGRERPITHFERVLVQDVEGASAPRPPVSTNTGQETTSRPEASLVLVFDEQNIRPETLRDARKAAVSFLESRIAGAGELVLVGTGGGAILRSRDQVGLEALRAQVAKMKAIHVRTPDEDAVSELEAMQIAVFNSQPTLDIVTTRMYALARAEGQLPTPAKIGTYPDAARGMAQHVWIEARTRAQATLAIVQDLAKLLAGRRGRKSVVLLTEGFVLDGRSPEWKRTLDTARRANVVVYAVDVRGLGQPDRLDAGTGRTPGLYVIQTTERGTPPTMDRGEAPLADQDASQGSDTLATQTGGFTRRYTNDLAGALTRIAAESRNYYLVGFEPAAQPDGNFHPLSVEVRRPGLTVRARKSYLALPRSETPASDPIPLRLTAYLLEPRGDAVHVQLVGECDPAAIRFEEHDGRRTAAVDWVLDVATPDHPGSESPRRLRLNLTPDAWQSVRTAWIPVGTEVDLPAGRHVARMFVRDGAEGGRVGELEHVFNVPSPHAPYVSSVLSDMARGGAGSPPAFVARRAFAAGAHLVYQFEVRGVPAGATHKLLAAHELRTADGVVLARGSESPLATAADGSLSRLIRISLEKTTPGHYELRVHVRDEAGGSRLDWAEPFEVIAAAPRAATGAAGSAPSPPEPPAPAARTQERAAAERSLGGPAPAGPTPLATVLERAGAYVLRYAESFRNVVAEETYTQRLEGLASQVRTLRSELVFIRLPGAAIPWGTFRDVFEVNAQKIRDRTARLERLFVSPTGDAFEQAKGIVAEGARYNLGDVYRNVNVPTLALLFLDPRNQPRLSFELRGTRTVAGFPGVEVAFDERSRPTIVRGRRGDEDVPARGRFWIDASRGTVLRTEIEYDLERNKLGKEARQWERAVIATEYRREPGLDIFVPDHMDEQYVVPGGDVECVARYSRYRHFEVVTEERVQVPEKPEPPHR